MAVLYYEALTEFNADCAEFCPFDPFTELLAVGTYQLDEDSGRRHGKLYLYSLQQQQQAESHVLQEEATMDMPGIFDLQWAQIDPNAASPAIGAGLADGTLRIVGTADGRMRILSQCQALATGMVLSVAWQPQPLAQPSQLAAVSSSGGHVSLLQVLPSGLQHLNQWPAHTLEVWTAAWDLHQPAVLYSGADDGLFRAWDVRGLSSCDSCGGGAAQGASPGDDAVPHHVPIFTNKKAHGAGVCCISSHPRRPHCLVTGSYDEAVRLWDLRMTSRPLESCQVGTGGGVWRLKWHPRHDSLLLAACMYNGFALVQANASFSSLEVVERYQGHQSIAYGADWYKGHQRPGTGIQSKQEQHQLGGCSTSATQTVTIADRHPPQGQEGGAGQLQPAGTQYDIAATCSFYDRRLHLWRPNFQITLQ